MKSNPQNNSFVNALLREFYWVILHHIYTHSHVYTYIHLCVYKLYQKTNHSSSRSPSPDLTG